MIVAAFLIIALGAGPAIVSSTSECQILAEVARSKFGFDRFVAPPLQPAGDYFPRCNWAAMGIKIAPAGTGGRLAKTIFYRPSVTANRALVSVLVIQGKSSGGKYECTLRRGAGRWYLKECTRRIAI